jgi:hypothetical protein
VTKDRLLLLRDVPLESLNELEVIKHKADYEIVTKTGHKFLEICNRNLQHRQALVNGKVRHLARDVTSI